MEIKTKHSLTLQNSPEIYFLGFSSATAAFPIISMINKYLHITLSHYRDFIEGSDPNFKRCIFTNFRPAIALNNPGEIDFSFDDISSVSRKDKAQIHKYILVECKGDANNLFPKLKPLDYLLISNYQLSDLKSTIKSIPDVTMVFDLNQSQLGNKVKGIVGILNN
ncbi:MAG: hypothetical protein ACOVP5_08300, partial [Chitinophagales bacterium]